MHLTARQQKSINAYTVLMYEIRLRADSISIFADPNIPLPAPTRAEACFLQIRLICEMIALGCLVAHEDIQEVKAARLQKAYEADFIIRALERLHPDFFPVPHTVKVRENALRNQPGFHYEAVTEGFLSKEQLVRVYRRAGAVLHRGSLQATFSSPRDQNALLSEVEAAQHQIVGLLRAHHIMTKDRKHVFVCSIPDQEHGEVQVAFASALAKGRCGCSDLVIV